MARKPIARVGDTHICPIHPPNAIVSGPSYITVDGQTIATVGSMTGCGATIVTGAHNCFGAGSPVAHLGSKTSHGGAIVTGSPTVFLDNEMGPSLFGQIVGGAKELLNQFIASNAAMSAEWMADQGIVQYQDSQTGGELTPEEVAERYKESDGVFPMEGEAQVMGAETIRNLPQTPAILAAVNALGSRGKSLTRDPEEIAAIIKKALTNSSSPSEALGKVGMEQAKKRLGMTTDSRYIDRHHGPDDMAQDKHKQLTELEAKGNSKNSTTVAKNKSKEKQGSAAKNKRRAELMTNPRKRKKIGIPSNRKGGAYTQEEVDLWREIKNLGGHKRHVSTHTNTETGQTRVFDRNLEGDITEMIDDFQIDDFEVIKKSILEAFIK